MIHFECLNLKVALMIALRRDAIYFHEQVVVEDFCAVVMRVVDIKAYKIFVTELLRWPGKYHTV